jgi:hypothetical protein
MGAAALISSQVGQGAGMTDDVQRQEFRRQRLRPDWKAVPIGIQTLVLVNGVQRLASSERALTNSMPFMAMGVGDRCQQMRNGSTQAKSA